MHKLRILTDKIFAVLLAVLLVTATPMPVFAEDVASTQSSAPATTNTTSEPAPTNTTETTAPAPATTPTTSQPSTTSEPAPASAPVLASTAPASTPNITDSTTANSVQNQLQSTSTSGNAAVADNRDAGSATTGDATATANLVNVAQTSTNAEGGTATTFVANVTGNTTGDMLIDPSKLATSQTTANPSLTEGALLVLTPTTIDNTLLLAATSGNATVADNTTAGSATTGDAAAMANIVNSISSIVGAKNTFVGVVNIFGDLHGDILIPASFMQKLADGRGIQGLEPSGTITIENNVAMDNNLTLAATSGNATVADNTHAGDATTGGAKTLIDVYNLIDQQTFNGNTLLVFVNVLGKWVGMIVNAPGSTKTTFGNNGTSETNESTIDPLHVVNSTSVTNTVSATARSGDAAVTDNRDAGNATTGNALASVKILNVVTSHVGFANWFGILFINVFGNWFGNFDIAKAPSAKTAKPPTPHTSSSNTQTVQSLGLGGSGDVTAFTLVANSAAPTPPTTPTAKKESVLGTTSSGQTPTGLEEAAGINALTLAALATALALLILGTNTSIRRYSIHKQAV